jgi:kynureninase
MTPLTRESCIALDRADALASYREQFELPAGVIYLDGNSLGPMSREARVSVQARMTEWQQDLIASWRKHDWLEYPARLGAALAPILGARPHEVQVTDSTSVNLFKLAASVVRQARSVDHSRRRMRIVTEAGNFPTVPYMLAGLAGLAGDIQLDVVPREQVLSAVDERTALVVLTHAHYLSAELFDLPAVTAQVQAAGAQILWDLSHSAGIMSLDLAAAHVDYAVGCGYKYLNGGPGAPAYLYVREDLQAASPSVLSGWLGHREPFAFADAYSAGEGLDRFRCGTPPVLAYAAFEGALKVFHGLDMAALRRKSVALGELLITLMGPALADHGLQLASPRDPNLRGGHVSFRHPYAQRLMAQLAEEGVIGDYRPPNILRFGLSPLYLRYTDIWEAAQKISISLAETPPC